MVTKLSKECLLIQMAKNPKIDSNRLPSQALLFFTKFFTIMFTSTISTLIPTPSYPHIKTACTMLGLRELYHELQDGYNDLCRLRL
jgi:hypothetical protein